MKHLDHVSHAWGLVIKEIGAVNLSDKRISEQTKGSLKTTLLELKKKKGKQAVNLGSCLVEEDGAEKETHTLFD